MTYGRICENQCGGQCLSSRRAAWARYFEIESKLYGCRARNAERYTPPSKIRTTHLKPYPVIVACTLLLDESIGSRHAELTFNVCALLAQAIDAFTRHNLPRRSVVVMRWHRASALVLLALYKRVLPCTVWLQVVCADIFGSDAVDGRVRRVPSAI